MDAISRSAKASLTPPSRSAKASLTPPSRSAKASLPDAPADARTWRLRFDRWWGLAGGLVLAVLDTLAAASLGIRFEVNGAEATWLTAAYFGSSFAALGFLIGWLVEVRRRERTAEAIIREQVETLAATRARLAQSEKLAALGQLASTIAHEVRNPLAVMRSAAQGLAEEPGDSAEAARACRFIIEEIDRLTNVVGSLLAFARPTVLDLRPVAVDDLFERTLQLAQGEMTAKRVRVRRRTSGALPALRADPDLLCQVLLDLVSNATEAVPEGGEVTLEAASSDGAVVLRVADTGPGVPAGLRERVFEPFFTTRTRGTGLGLAVARQLVEAHGGTIAVGERPGGGACFTLSVPAASGAVAAA
jgi:signal transduction histidine kinase